LPRGGQIWPPIGHGLSPSLELDKRSWEKEALFIARAAGAGTAIGAIAGRRKDAGIGAAAGGVGGLIFDLMTRENKNTDLIRETCGSRR